MQVEQNPSPGARNLRFCGETVAVRLLLPKPIAGRAFLRTNLGNAHVRRREIIAAVEERRPRLDTDWHDLPMRKVAENEFLFEATLDEVGVFQAKAFFQAETEDQLHWPQGENLTVKVEPASLAAANTVYTAFIRQFGPNKNTGAIDPEDEKNAELLESKGCTVIPRSGKFRDFIKELDFIISDMGFRIIQLLPVHPIPTTYARMGRFGSPFAALDFENVDRGLADFDSRTTPLEQFMEVIQEIHARDGKVLMDIALNHTGWASQLQIHHPEWFPRNPDGSFKSPGAWGVVWADLTELDYSHISLWKYVARVFLYWCEKGVDGFRCDAGYMLPFAVWEYVVAKVRELYPETVFLLEGLGGKVSTTENLLGKAGLNWAYSELFQNYDRDQIEDYLPVGLEIENTSGLLVNYAETHDNDRLAATSKNFARLRTAVCALCSQCGAFAITNGVEWFADKKVDVHGAPSLNWGAADNQVDWLRRLNAIVCHHPAFQHDSTREMIQSNGGNSLALLRKTTESKETVLVLANLSPDSPQPVHWQMPQDMRDKQLFDLLTVSKTDVDTSNAGSNRLLQPGEVVCLVAEYWDTDRFTDFNHFGPALDRWRFRAKYIEIKKSILSNDTPLPPIADAEIDQFMDSPLDALRRLGNSGAPLDIKYTLPNDLRREVMVPPGMFLVVQAEKGFLLIERANGTTRYTDRSLALAPDRHIVVVPPPESIDQAEHRELELHMFTTAEEGPDIARGTVLRLSSTPPAIENRWPVDELARRDTVALSTNANSSVSYMRAAWAGIRSQYDCILAVNPGCAFPSDRRILWTRCRCWLVCKDYSRELSLVNMVDFTAQPGEPVVWRFLVPIGRGYALPFRIEATLDQDPDQTTLLFHREAKTESDDYPVLPANEPVSLIARPDIEDRNFHSKTKAFMGPEKHYPKSIKHSQDGFSFQPNDIRLDLKAPGAVFVYEPEWQYMVEHPIDGERGLEDSSDLFSPGYFTVDLKAGDKIEITGQTQCNRSQSTGNNTRKDKCKDGNQNAKNPLLVAANKACRDFIVNRNHGSTIIAGYPWFLDWGRDTLIALRGIISLGWHELALSILQEFARFEENGTIPNMIHGDDASNRDTSDAPLWLFRACRDLIEDAADLDVLGADCGGRGIGEVLVSIAENYYQGTPNGIAVDKSSGLVYSPEHFTWMDTQYPAGTPRAGYPIEIQSLWSAALDFLATDIDSGQQKWREMRNQVNESIERLYILADGKGLADCLHAAGPLQKADDCIADDHCRPNQLFAVTLGDILPNNLEIEVIEACWKLIVPGAIRSLADSPVEFELPVQGTRGDLLNKPRYPYWGHYAGDEDTRRKPAYHNGTAWTWPFPSFCEALLKAYGTDSTDIARALLDSCAELFNSGCAGHLPEILDGDAPHLQRGCSAQAWGATEVARVASMLGRKQH